MGTKIVLFLLKITDVGAKFGNLAKIINMGKKIILTGSTTRPLFYPRPVISIYKTRKPMQDFVNFNMTDHK